MSDVKADDEALFARFHGAFRPGEVKPGSKGGRQYDYIQDDVVTGRLDDVVGPAGWEDVYTIIDESTVECALTITLADGRKVTRRGVGSRVLGTKPGDASGTWRAAYTFALKSAGKKFGIGRGLNGRTRPRFLDRVRRRENEPAASAPAPLEPAGPPTHINRDLPPGPPRSGGALWAWLKEQEVLYDLALSKMVMDWGQRQGYPRRYVAWTGPQALAGHAEALRTLEQWKGEGGEELQGAGDYLASV